METAYDFDGYRRLNERKNYRKEVSFSTESMIFPATLKNISMGGALVGTTSIPKIRCKNNYYDSFCKQTRLYEKKSTGYVG